REKLGEPACPLVQIRASNTFEILSLVWCNNVAAYQHLLFAFPSPIPSSGPAIAQRCTRMFAPPRRACPNQCHESACWLMLKATVGHGWPGIADSGGFHAGFP